MCLPKLISCAVSTFTSAVAGAKGTKLETNRAPSILLRTSLTPRVVEERLHWANGCSCSRPGRGDEGDRSCARTVLLLVLAPGLLFTNQGVV